MVSDDAFFVHLEAIVAPAEALFQLIRGLPAAAVFRDRRVFRGLRGLCFGLISMAALQPLYLVFKFLDALLKALGI